MGVRQRTTWGMYQKIVLRVCETERRDSRTRKRKRKISTSFRNVKPEGMRTHLFWSVPERTRKVQTDLQRTNKLGLWSSNIISLSMFGMERFWGIKRNSVLKPKATFGLSEWNGEGVGMEMEMGMRIVTLCKWWEWNEKN